MIIITIIIKATITVKVTIATTRYVHFKRLVIIRQIGLDLRND